MAQKPTVDQFPTFAETCLLMKEKKRQCIWYLPARGRRCLIRLTDDDEAESLQQAGDILTRTSVDASSILKELTSIAERSCCPRHHRNPMYGSGMAQKLAQRWLGELMLAVAATPPPKDFKEFSPPLDVDVPSSLGSSFARHHVHESETLFTQICSPIEIQRRTTGSIYFYTHQNNKDFTGMVKIGYTTATVQSRLNSWHECGFGYPDLLGRIDNVRHAQRVELLTHFELLESWHAIRWCKQHAKPHIEWFRVEFAAALAIATQWSRWMESENPYDRRGCLQASWKGHVEFLQEHDVAITGKAMMQIRDIELGLAKVDDFVDDDALRGSRGVKVKPEEDMVTLANIPLAV